MRYICLTAGLCISIHALREEGDVIGGQVAFPIEISIHALREEGDVMKEVRRLLADIFLSTPSARRATRLFS